ncbi:hypothetical protein CRG98_009955 [Punica granatum]|uniref:Uncharacterized protein n=1 Tax=Punica granatum TaxID=22663 RepID=A0A2I0KMH1_PUNGR|nr:hypothetical protein CRG98_009955 [Punica granatum]
MRAPAQRQSQRGRSCSRHRARPYARRTSRAFFRVHACTHAPVTHRTSPAHASARSSPRIRTLVTAHPPARHRASTRLSPRVRVLAHACPSV